MQQRTSWFSAYGNSLALLKSPCASRTSVHAAAAAWQQCDEHSAELYER